MVDRLLLCNWHNMTTLCTVIIMWGFKLSVVVVGPTPPPKNGGRVQQPFLCTPADGISPI